MVDLFSYTEAWSCRKKGNQLYRYLRYSYFFKGLALSLVLPFDILYLIAIRIFIGRSNPGYVFNSSKALNQCFDAVGDKSKIVFLVSDPIAYVRCGSLSIRYIPASPIYIICGILPWRGRFREISNKIIIKFAKFLLSQLFTPGRIIFVMHSDALPFARSLLFAMQDCPIYSPISVVIQHGIFHEHFDCTELDGSLANVNVTRSEFDTELIKRNNKNSLFIVSKNFFLPSVSESIVDNVKPVILVGEGFHVVDRQLSQKYISQLKTIEQELLSYGWCVKYRPHPSEKLNYRSFGFMNIDTANLSESLGSALAYIGYSSTLLVEAASIGIPCYAVKIDGEEKVNFQRNPGTYEIVDYQISIFNPSRIRSELATNANSLRKIAQIEVFSEIEEVCCV